MKIPESHKNLLKILQEKESQQEPITQDEILQKSGWQASTFQTYLNKGQLSDFLHESRDKHFEVSNTISLSEQEFSQLLSQSKHRRGLGHNCKSKLSKALLRKSKDNMLLALELYNRPSLENRIDGFVLCFCIAWEQLLKAILIEKNGEEFIFKKQKIGRVRETISLRECLENSYDTKDKIRDNIERIQFYRDQAVHLLMPEAQGIMSRVFQSGVLNYSTEFQKFTQQTFFSANHSGLLSLVGDLKNPSVTALCNRYGKEVGTEIFNLINDLTDDVDQKDDIQFAIPLEVELVFATKDKKGNTITLAKAEDGIEGLRKAIIVSKPKDRELTHPYKESSAIREINKRLYERHSEDILTKHLVNQNKKTKKYEINTYCFRALIEKLKWRNSNNLYHHKNKDPEYHYYSDASIEELIKKIMENEDYLKNARSHYSAKIKKSRNK
ncbi:DUF3644 domain-containing protein [Picosynechococcus sp. PCC 8807]|uniref:DUF3644 domain-containing protein n=1 Tax=Picosynechococcus sp. PCC 8807 TaxID=195248 RepID=UPI000810EAC6|nr:DUF3644 domain-containing protein [Picosynechococcus sp. PCC 8807]ANV89912.1 hypothetical protein AWQ24_04305 [Picosynechococcus sp. PCC 8807]